MTQIALNKLAAEIAAFSEKDTFDWFEGTGEFSATAQRLIYLSEVARAGGNLVSARLAYQNGDIAPVENADMPLRFAQAMVWADAHRALQGI
ncbi:hypothetical protein HT136_23205 [Novosphingobium profundi]|uniref:hypothetical protein n=1 Tax=Novosphingobium profundi TaxID=1774954 RepID=UPI001BD98566|nr:hypothetical protein [Novosphingobium profundi]MBT0671283.1 hypothetical protein [Novosphingobium profundi]